MLCIHVYSIVSNMVLLESFVEALTLMVVDKSPETSRHLLCTMYTIYCNLFVTI